jgi:uncharacterized metal-binding protein
MPSGKTHNKINKHVWLITLLIFAKYHTSLDGIFRMGTWDNYLIPTLQEYNLSTFFYQHLAAIWFCFFSLDFYIHTIYLNPDLDTASDATRKLRSLGKIIDMLFKHRGPLHWISIWILIFAPLCWVWGSFFVGGFLAGVCHIVCDDIQTWTKRTWIYKCVKKSWVCRVMKRAF